MKTVTFLLIAFSAAVHACCAEVKDPLPQLHSLHGTTVMMISEEEGLPFETWAKGDNTRMEVTDNLQKIITIQRGDTIYTYSTGSTSGIKQTCSDGLASMGLIKQIAEVKKHGIYEGAQEIDGVVHHRYRYEVNAPETMAVVLLSTETSLPRYWLSVVMIDDETGEIARTVYRDMEANKEIDDNLFAIPQEVAFNALSSDQGLPAIEEAAESELNASAERILEDEAHFAVVVVNGAEIVSRDVIQATPRVGAVLRIARTEGEWLLVHDATSKGWIASSVVVPASKAFAYFGRVIERDPLDVDAWCGRGFFLAWMAQHTADTPAFDGKDVERLLEQAAEDFEKAASINTSVDVLTGRGLVRGLQGHYQFALADLDAALTLDPDNAEALHHRALALVKLNEFDRVIADCDRLLQIDSRDAAAHSLRCEALGLKGELDEALTEGNAAININPELAISYARRGAIWAGKGNDTRAKADYDRAITLGDDSVRWSRARILAAEGSIEEAIADLDAAIVFDPRFGDYYFARGSLLLQLEEVERAISDLGRAIELAPSAGAFVNRGAAWAMKGDTSKAVEDFTMAISLDPTLSDSYLNRGRLLVELADYENAIGDLSEYIKLAPVSAEGFEYRGLARYFSGQHETVLEDVNRAIELAPNNQRLYVLRGSVWNHLKKFDQAITDFTHAIVLDPASAESYAYRGVAYQQLGEDEKAISDFNIAVRIDESFYIAYVNRGTHWLRNKEYGKAIEDYRTAIRLNPHPAVLNELAWLRATVPDATYRNATEARSLAEKACESSNWEDAEFLSTLAAAHAESGDFQAAVMWQSKSAQLAEGAFKATAEQRLAQFKNNEPLSANHGSTAE